MELGRIRTIHRYPVKSMGGESLPAAQLGSQGIPGDRGFAVRDEVRGGIRGAKKIPALMQLQARYRDEPEPGRALPVAEITLPDGSQVDTSAPDVGERLSKALDHPVTLWPLLPAEVREHYRRGAPDHADVETELRALFGREPGEPLPDLGKFPPELFEFESLPGTYFDAFPLLLLSEQSLRSMQEAAPASRFDMRRFRPNLLVDAPGDARFPETGWLGARLRVGEAELRVTVDCPRCVMTTHGFADLPRDPAVMRALVREAGGSLGVYASVERPGRVRVGDALIRLEDRS